MTIPNSFVIFLVYAFFQTINFIEAAGFKDVAAEKETEGRPGDQRNIIDDIFSSVSGLFSSATTQKPPKILYDDIIITPPSFPAPDDPHFKPGTTNNGGPIDHIFATFSGLASGFFGVIGLNENGPVHVVGLFNPTKPSFPLMNDIRYQIDSFKTGLNNARDPQKFPSNPQQISNILPAAQSQQDGVGNVQNVVNGILGQVTGCNEIRKLLGQC